MEQYSNISISVCSSVLVLFNFFGNTLVCVVILRNNHMRTPLNYLLFNLAVTDILIGMLSLPGILMGSLFDGQEGATSEFFCKFFTYGTLIFLFGEVSALSLAAVAYERYQAVVYPLTVKETITKKKTFAFIILAWIYSIATSLPWYIFVGLSESDPPKCIIKFQYIQAAIIQIFIFGISSYGIPLLVMIILYGRIIWELCKKHDQVLNQNQLVASRVKTKITTMLIIITFIFAALWSVCSAYIIKYGSTRKDFIAWICTLVILINSSVNWILYALFSEQFRNGFKRALSCCCKKNVIVGQEVNHLPVISQGEEEPRRHNTIDTRL